MKQFFKMVFATMVGFLLSYLLIFFVGLMILFGIIAAVSSDDESEGKSNTVLRINLNYNLTERTSSNPFQDFDWQSMHASKRPGLNDILVLIKKASTDDHIKGIFLDLNSIQAGMGTIEEIRNELIAFKSTGKFIYTYSENLEQGAYYLASVSDKIYLNPQGIVDFKGLRSELMFFKKSFEKLEVEPQIIRHGKYKSFIEPFVNEKMSPENREQMELILGTAWTHLKNEIGKSRKISPEELQLICDQFSIRKAADAQRLRMVDSLVYLDGFMDALKSKLGLSEKEKISFVKLSSYQNIASTSPKKAFEKSKIAVIYATGGISSGESDDENIGSDDMSETIRKARLDSNVKAIVLRVNSPGGSALASEVIWREVVLAKKTKPVVVSMGDVAASGGYYIACGADKIVAQPNTITGSIGVLGIFFNGQKLLNNKLGIQIDTVKTGPYADLGSPTRPLTSSEKAIYQEFIENVYDVFTSRVSEGRKMSKEFVDSIGQGRVWIGTDAKRLGLVDELGGIKDAIRIAASLAKIETYRITELPEQKEPFEELMEDLTGDVLLKNLKAELGTEEYVYYKQLREIMRHQGIQARMPYSLEIY